MDAHKDAVGLAFAGDEDAAADLLIEAARLGGQAVPPISLIFDDEALAAYRSGAA